MSEKEANKKILIVDDEPDILDILSFHLEGFGWETELASTPYEALEKLDNRDYFLIITDIAMPGMDGYELITELNRKNCSSQIALMTGFGYNPKHTLVRINQKHKYPLFFKPFELTKSTIQDTVKELFNKYHS